ncbi:MAG: hypothetical protein KKF44_07380 [Nanoarchaeota archaeon]|nr:hypothetical protein [Nanoarchaeota archaeon]
MTENQIKKKAQTKKIKFKKAKKSTSKRLSKKLTEAKPEHYFILTSGVAIKNLKELVGSLETMNEGVFRHHVNDERNDFANWVRDILNEPDLADELKDTWEIKDTEIKILKFMIQKYL